RGGDRAHAGARLPALERDRARGARHRRARLRPGARAQADDARAARRGPASREAHPAALFDGPQAAERLMRLLLLLFSLAFSAGLLAQPYPAKPIRIVVPFPAGGIADLYARLIGARVGELWKQPVLIENRTGAGGNIGADAVAKSAPDGYNLVMGSFGTHAVNVSLFSSMPYDPVRDFAPIALVLEAEGLLVVHPSVPAQSVLDLIAYARAHPARLTFASAGMGTA